MIKNTSDHPFKSNLFISSRTYNPTPSVRIRNTYPSLSAYRTFRMANIRIPDT